MAGRNKPVQGKHITRTTDEPPSPKSATPTVFTRHRLRSAIISASAIATTTAGGLANGELEEIVVTATKRAEPMQDIPVAISALSAESLGDFRISTFDDYIRFLPNVTQQGTAPGHSEIFIRGATTEQSIVSISTVQGSSPQVALYLDEQPVSFGGRNLDIYATDLERIEVLPGPQGTLFGTSSQAGTVRLITAKPDHAAFNAGFDTGISSTRGGEMSNSVEAFVNVPLNERLAVRVAGYNARQGGWIDNIANDPANGGYRPRAEVLARNSIAGFGFPEGTNADDLTMVQAENSEFIENDFNDATYRGARFSASYLINPDWDLLLQHTRQTLDSDGVFSYDPQLEGRSSTNRFNPDRNKDEFGLTTWTLEGRLRELDLIYTGGFLDRDVDSTIDYTGYTNGGGYQVYYVCDNVDYGTLTFSGPCFDPTKVYREDSENRRWTHELRVQTPAENRWQATVGVFYDSQKTESVGEFQLGAPSLLDADGNVLPGTGKFQFPLELVGNDVPGTNAGGRQFPPDVTFVNDFTRETDQLAVFGELRYDLTDAVRASVGARWYDIDFDFKGSTNSLFGPNNVTARLAALGQGRDAIESSGIFSELEQEIILGGEFNLSGLDDDGVVNESDVIFRASLDWRVVDNALLFATYAEGFRPPVTNRNAGRAANNQVGPFENYAVPAIATTDDLENWELGIKSEWLDGTLRLNATAFYSEITNLQTSRFDPSNVAFLVFIENVGDAEIVGLDADFAWMATPRLVISGAISLLDTELTRINPQLDGIAVPKGSKLPFAPDFSGNLRATYDFGLPAEGIGAYVSAAVSYTGDSRSGIAGSAAFVEDTARLVYGRGTGLEIKEEGGTFFSGGRLWPNSRYVQRSYTLMDLAFGVRMDGWRGELFIDNVTDERAEVHVDTLEFTPRVVTNRPRTFGLRLSYQTGS